MRKLIYHNIIFILFGFLMLSLNVMHGQTFKIVDTGQNKYYDNFNEISSPSAGEDFYGQDAHYSSNQPSYTDNGDGTITDNVTELMWQKSPDTDGDGDIDAADKLSYKEALEGAAGFNLAGYDDWRLPNIKEQYSLIMFYGLDPSGYRGTSTENLVPFLNIDYFDFGYGDTDAGERIIDAQFATSTIYVSTTMKGAETMFGVNFADGRIKGYPTGPMPGQTDDKGFFVLYVRGNSNYGINDFIDNSDGTITDNATGLMWTKDDNPDAVNWQEALAWVNEKNSENYLGFDDWRLPDAKELQSIVDYTRAPSVTGSPAIDPFFSCTIIKDEGSYENYPFYWSSTTHANMINGGYAAYVCFGEGLGWMDAPPNSGNYQLMDVHGAGSQRSDPKTGDPEDYPYGHGPQGDVIRVYNYVRLVRDAIVTGTEESQSDSGIPNKFELYQNYPNPFNPVTIIKYKIPDMGNVRTGVDPNLSGSDRVYAGRQLSLPLQIHVILIIYDILGCEIKTLVNQYQSPGTYEIEFNALSIPSGVYLYRFQARHPSRNSGQDFVQAKRMVLLK